MTKIVKTLDQWRAELDPETFYVTRQKGTERPFSGELCHTNEAGLYECKCCGQTLFDATAKFDSGCGWPSFDASIAKPAIVEHFDESHGMRRTEIVCSQCDAHLGHVFTDGPTETGLRYCVNSVSLNFVKEEC